MALTLAGVMSPKVGPSVLTFTAPNPSTGFGSIVVYNASNSAVNLFLGSIGILTLVPDYTISGGSVMTLPIPGISDLTVAFVTFPAGGGNVNISITDTVLTAASNGLPAAVGASGVPPGASVQNNYLGNIGVMQSAVAYVSGLESNDLASSVNLTNGVLAANYPTYVYTLSITGCVVGIPPNTNLGMFLKFVDTLTLGTDLFWMVTQFTLATELGAGFTIGELAYFLSGGDLPLFRIPANTGLSLIATSTGGALGDMQGFLSVCLTYAQF